MGCVGRLAFVTGAEPTTRGRRGRWQGSWSPLSALGLIPLWPLGLAADHAAWGRRRGTTAVPDTCAGCWRWLGAGWRRGRRGLAVPTSPPASSPAEAPGPVLPGPRRLPESGVLQWHRSWARPCRPRVTSAREGALQWHRSWARPCRPRVTSAREGALHERAAWRRAKPLKSKAAPGYGHGMSGFA